MLEAFFKTPVLLPYNGNILLDHASDLVPIECEKPVEPQPIVVNKPKVQSPVPAAKPVVTKTQDWRNHSN